MSLQNNIAESTWKTLLLHWKNECLSDGVYLLSPGVDHDVLGDLGVAGVGRDVQSGPAVPAGQAGVGPGSDQQPHHVEAAGQCRCLKRGVPLVIDQIDINLL